MDPRGLTLAPVTVRPRPERQGYQPEPVAADLDERLRVLVDVVEASVDRQDPLIVDLGCGSGALAGRLAERMPGASVVAVDSDLTVLERARAGYRDRPGPQFVAGRVGTPGWTSALTLDRAPDAFVSSGALHTLSRRRLFRLVSDAATALRPGGVFVNADRLIEGDLAPHLDRLARLVRERHDPPSVTDADMRSDNPTFSEHIALLRAVGFVEAGAVWQRGDDRILVAVRDRVLDGHRVA
jgi:SAM-dependent methyltransferase